MRAYSRYKKNIRVKVALLLIFVFMLVPLCAFAQIDNDRCNVTAADVSAKKAVQVLVPIPGITQVVDNHHYTKDMSCYIVGIYRYFAGVAGILATVMMMWGGFQYVISTGNQQKLSEAKDTITGALVGLLLVMGSYSILYLINPNLTTFSVPQISHIEEMKWGDCGPYASYSQEREQCVLQCPTGYSPTDCYMCKTALAKHDILWSNDICTTGNMGIGNTIRVEPGTADKIQDLIGEGMYYTVIAGQVYLFGGPAAATVKAVLGKLIGTALKITLVEEIFNFKKFLKENPLYQGKTVFTNAKAVCCAQDNKEAGASVCQFVNGFAKLWEGQCSGILPCKDHTPCGTYGPNNCWGIYAEDNVCVITWGVDDNTTDWGGMSTREGDPKYNSNANLVPRTMQIWRNWDAGAFQDTEDLCGNDLVNVPIDDDRHCNTFHEENGGRIIGLGVNCPTGYQCVVTHSRNGRKGYIDGDVVSRVDGEICVEAKWEENIGWNRFTSDYNLFNNTAEDDMLIDEAYWLAKGGHCLPVDN